MFIKICDHEAEKYYPAVWMTKKMLRFNLRKNSLKYLESSLKPLWHRLEKQYLIRKVILTDIIKIF